MEHCPYLKSYAHTSDSNLFLVSHIDADYSISVLDLAENVHSVHSLCGLEVVFDINSISFDVQTYFIIPIPQPACYQLDIGAGKYSDRTERTFYDICGISGYFPMSATMCMINNSTDCTLSNIVTPSCESGKTAMKMIKTVRN